MSKKPPHIIDNTPEEEAAIRAAIATDPDTREATGPYTRTRPVGRPKAMHIKSIKTEADYDAALRILWPLMGAELGSPEADQLETLSALVEAYELQHHPIGPYAEPNSEWEEAYDGLSAILSEVQNGTGKLDAIQIESIQRAQEFIAKFKEK